jgi:hypothetical protein
MTLFGCFPLLPFRRVMVKNTMKLQDVKANKPLHRLLNARQFGKLLLGHFFYLSSSSLLRPRQGLKLIANVTYGYTAAGWSGRMPCADIADAIVQTGPRGCSLFFFFLAVFVLFCFFHVALFIVSSPRYPGASHSHG